MSDDEQQGHSHEISRLLLLFGFTIIIIGIVGIFWWQLKPNRYERRTNPENAAQEDGNDQNLYTSNPILPSPASTVSAPSPPTAIATSLPSPTRAPLPTFENPLKLELKQEAESWDVEFFRLDQQNTGLWQFQSNSFIHPIAVEVNADSAFLVDGGRVLEFRLDEPLPPRTLLMPGADIDGVRVLEPLDLAVASDTLFVLDRAGDIYSYDLHNKMWQVYRYDRPVEESSGHYFVGLDQLAGSNKDGEANPGWIALLETNYKFAMLYNGESTSLWNLEEGRSIDLTGYENHIYILQREMHSDVSTIRMFEETRSIKEFNPRIEIVQPRQLDVSEEAVYVLDQNGRRLRALDPVNGKLLRLYQLPQIEPVSTFAVTEKNELILAGRDRLYFLDQPDRLAVIPGEIEDDGPYPHDSSFLATLDDYTVPIRGSNITFRDFQLPGAPRHYRLGVHQGIDFYWQPGTKVVAANDGVVVRADIDYIPPNAYQIASWWSDSQEHGYTTAETLDKYLGRQVWIQHSDGLVSRYAHLRSIEPGIIESTHIKRGQIIGEVGNSGSPASLESESSDAHLHYELWLGNYYLGQYLRPIESREWIESIFIQRDE
ncbi:MAG: M23 family metallopeptidase [Candidatus Promineifilaceae bacterium]|nr:M23 family metallopeptidase [Candidatus Promineifilaceae bacterium]